MISCDSLHHLLGYYFALFLFDLELSPPPPTVFQFNLNKPVTAARNVKLHYSLICRAIPPILHMQFTSHAKYGSTIKTFCVQL